MNKYSKLMNNSIIFAIGNFGSKLINFILVPLYTYVLTTQDYGTVDLLINTVGLVVPFASLLIGQSVLRFILDNKNKYNNKEIFSNGFVITSFGAIVTVIVVPIIINQTSMFTDYKMFFVLYIILNSFSDFFSQFARSIGKIKEFAVNGVIVTVVTAGLNIFLLISLKMGINGYFLSTVIANVISIVYLIFITNSLSYFSTKDLSLVTIKRMLRYSIPMIPNSIMWWLSSSVTRYIILIFLGSSANGLYAVANKLPSVISMLTSIFQQAWQLSAFEEYDSNDKSLFYSKIFEWYYQSLFIAGSFLLVITKPLMSILVEKSYFESWIIIPSLILAAIYQTFAAFLGTTYTSSKYTKGLFTTTVYSGIIAIVANLIFIPLIGIMGAGIGNAISFILLFIIRLFDTKKWVEIKINLKRFLFINGIYILQTFVLFSLDNSILYYIEGILFIILAYSSRTIVNDIYIGFKKRGKVNAK